VDDGKRLPKASTSKAVNATKSVTENGCGCEGENGYCYAFECGGWCQDYACECFQDYPCHADDGYCYPYDCGHYCSSSGCWNSALVVASAMSVASEATPLQSSAAMPKDSQASQGTKHHGSPRKGVAHASAVDDGKRLPKASTSKAVNATKSVTENGCGCEGENGYCYAFECGGWCQDYACECFQDYPCHADDGYCYPYDCGHYCSSSGCWNSALVAANNPSVAP